MKLLHISDLHIGKQVNGFSMLEEQIYILEQVIQFVKDEKPDALLIAGDVYDKPVPNREAVKVFDQFITSLWQQQVAVLLISGNHDSPERLGVMSRLVQDKKIYIYSDFNKTMKKVTLSDEYGEVNFYMLPFIKPTMVKRFYEEEEIQTYQDAVEIVLKHTTLDKEKRNVIIAHQFVVNTSKEPERSDSEIGPVGGVDAIDVKLFHDYDYTALGHLHGFQQVGDGFAYYSGSLMKYSFSECRQNKGMVLVELKEKGEITTKQHLLSPIHDMRKIRGPLEDLLREEVTSKANTDDYMHVTLTDDNEIIDAIGKVRKVYKNVMALTFDNSRTNAVFELKTEGENMEPSELFSEFFESQNGTKLEEEQQKIIFNLLVKEEGII